MGGFEGVIVLDTQAWLWWMHDPEKLSRKVRRRINGEEKKDGLLVSVISLWEIAVKSSIGKLRLPMEIHAWYEKAKSYPGIAMISISPADAIESTCLPGNFHKDPADRFIVTLSRRLGVPLVTKDEKIRKYQFVETIW